MGWIKVLVLAVLATAGSLAEAAEERRVALIVGNDAYRAMKPLDNAVNDARAIERELKALGWETTLKTNAGRRDLHAAIDAFGGKLSSGAVGLFYYAGHGIEARGQNFLVPVDATVETESDLRSDAVEAAEVIATMKAADNPMNIVILDACRDNPLKARSGSRGLAVIPVAGGSAGMFVAYAAAPGEKADDGAKGGNGVFTAELVKALQVPGLTIEQVFKRSVAGVKDRTGGRQVPWTQASLSGDFYFRPGAAKAEVPVTSGGGGDKEALFWSTIKDSKDGADFDAYLKRYPNGDFADLARNRLEGLKGRRTPGNELTVSVAAATPAPAAKVLSDLRSPGTVFRDCAECPEMVVVPAGSFVMGSPMSEPGRDENEGPQHRVTLSRPFAVGRFPVTFEEWDACVASGGCNGNRPDDQGLGRGRRAVNLVTWHEAQSYVRWLNSKTYSQNSTSVENAGAPYRLLTEAEWEYAARAGTVGHLYTGRTDTADREKNSPHANRLKPVGSFAPNPFGLFDMFGNVSQWVQDCYKDGYDDAPVDGRAVEENKCTPVYRGSAWLSGRTLDRFATRRGNIDAGAASDMLGFRLARTLP
ncbi:MAG: SUMF1/EgtB/PvdO family nonheme iron enzyme [Magnetospirillum sp.]|nr:SUMF1/EgtB/PvdO family nonheme iron enzyme [Magnetospirillum sp.]